MRRRYLRDTFSDRLNKIREVIPDAGIGADVIVGFPGEGDAEFNETYEFIRSMDISYLHVFTFSERPGTAAAGMKPVVPNRVRDERSKILHLLSEEKRSSFHKSQEGRVSEVLFERQSGRNTMTGFTGNYIETEVALVKEYLNTLQRVVLCDSSKGPMKGRLAHI